MDPQYNYRSLTVSRLVSWNLTLSPSVNDPSLLPWAVPGFLS